jgi:ABC-2 type transport system ATP-binding protein
VTTIEVTGVSKWFGGVVALSEVSFSVGEGVTALLGPNGAGKSTLMRLLCGLTPPSQGAVRVLGRSVRADISVSADMGLVPQQENLFDHLPARRLVTFAAELQGVSSPEQAARAALELVELDPADRRPVAQYSKGMRQRVKIAQALAHEPRVLILDEPLEGLDPRQRRHMIELFRSLGDQGRTVLVSSHVLDEVERFGSRVLVLVQGRLAAEGDFRAIRDLMDDRPHRIRITTDDPYGLGAGLLRTGVASAVQVGTNVLDVETTDVGRFRRTLAPAAQRARARLFSVQPLDDNLESVFAYLVRR